MQHSAAPHIPYVHTVGASSLSSHSGCVPQVIDHYPYAHAAEKEVLSDPLGDMPTMRVLPTEGFEH